jgi:hypothetical protein
MKGFFLAGIIFLGGVALAAGESWTVRVIDQELGTPLQGTKLTVSGSAQLYITDAQGLVKINLPETGTTLILTARYPGYAVQKTALLPGVSTVVVKMLLSGVIQGQELVVERPKPQQTESQAGVSQSVSHEDLQNTAKIGLREDIMTTIKTLPGVGYSGALGGARPTIRGGAPNETTATLDGAYILDPYYWGGAYSIFNPDWVSSASLSDGVTSAKYGQFIAGLLDVSALSPSTQVFHGSLDLSTTGVDGFLQAPLGKGLALFLGGNVTTLDYILKAVGAGNVFSQAPYYRSGFARLIWEPTPAFKSYLNAYVGQDGVGVVNNSTDHSLTTNEAFTYTTPEFFVTAGAKILLNDTNQLDLLFHFNTFAQSLSGQSSTNGTKAFDQSFIDQYHPSTSSFTLDNFSNTIGSDLTQYLGQAKTTWTWQASPGQIFSLGQESLLQFWTNNTQASGWQTIWQNGQPSFYNRTTNITTTGNKTWTQALFGLWDFTLIPQVLTGELGLRVDDSTIFNDQMTLATQPAVNPRLLLTYTMLRDWGILRSFSLVGGTGLFSQFNATDPYIDKKYGVSDFQISPERAWFNELGWEALSKDGWKFDLTAYWRYEWSRSFDLLSTSSNLTSLQTNGTGNAYGFDIFLKKETRFWQTWLSYSFIVVRLFDPGNSGQTATNGDPLGTWFFPSYQRFHNLSYVLTVSPWAGFSVTTEAQVASGVPLTSLGPVQAYAATGIPGVPLAEFFAQSSSYSDTLRSGWVYPVDLKLSWHGYFSGSKIRWEFYLGVQDIFAALYYKSSLGNAPLDLWYGDSLSGGNGANFSAGVPIPSLGYSVSF